LPGHRIFLIKHEIKTIIDTTRSASYLDMNLKFENDVLLRRPLYDKGDDFIVSIVNLLFVCSNIPAATADGVYTLYLSVDTFQNVCFLS